MIGTQVFVKIKKLRSDSGGKYIKLLSMRTRYSWKINYLLKLRNLGLILGVNFFLSNFRNFYHNIAQVAWLLYAGTE